jgi:hypothetical protein
MQNLRNLYNQALTAVGSAADVADPAGTGRSVDICNLWYPVARHAVFCAAHWPSLRSIKRLALSATRDTSATWVDNDPAPGYLFSYAAPSDMLQPQFMEDFTPFRMTRVGAEKVIHSNVPQAILCYTQDDASPLLWEPDLYRAVIWSLAACINMAKSGKMDVTQKLERQVFGIISQAEVNAANSDDEYHEAIPIAWAGTGFEIPNHQPRYVYPVSTFNLGLLST